MIGYQTITTRLQTLTLKYHNLAIKSQILSILLGSPIFFYYDSPAFNAIMPYGQWVADYIMFWTFIWFYWFAHPRLKTLMFLTVFMGFGMEFIGSILLKAYTYRLDNIPLYVPLGHSIILATVTHIQKQPLIRKHAIALNVVLYRLAIVICGICFLVFKDIVGTFVFLIFLILFQNRKNRLSHLMSLFLAYYIEIIGTQLHIWAWYSVNGNHPTWPHISNPSPGTCSLYIVLHLLVINSYLLLTKTHLGGRFFLFLKSKPRYSLKAS